MKLYTYDLETYPNCFLFCGKFEDSEQIYMFEVSTRMNERDALLSHLDFVKNSGAYMIGFNSMAFDYPIVHELMMNPWVFSYQSAYLHAQKIIHLPYGQNPNTIRLQDRLIPQIDLVKINHFDNANRRTSLKSLQFAMRSSSVEDLPYDPNADLTSDQMDMLVDYGIHDVTETEAFMKKCKHLIDMRQELLDNGVLQGDVLNFNDVKIGTQYLTNKIGRAKCFSGSQPKQTKRDTVAFKDVILPKIQFRTPEFDAVKDWFNDQKIYIRPDEKQPKLETELAGLPFVFGLGGVHASVERKRFYSSDSHAIIDIDVAGMYVAVAISNGFSPEHLGRDFVTAYRQLQADRAAYKKGTTMNAVLKLAGNGVYGQSNSPFSCFYDPKYTFTVTVNGQLQLIQLAEMLSFIQGLELIQANTDGITAYVPRSQMTWFKAFTTDWENETGLVLEHAEYSRMFIRDVNNYVAVGVDGKIKRKGAYAYPTSDKDYEGFWNKDYSNMSAAKGVELVMNYGIKPEEAIHSVTNPFDFMIRYKTPAGAKVYIGEKEQLRTVRYYVSKSGAPMRKIAGAKGPVGQYKRANKITDGHFKSVMDRIGPGVHDPSIHTKNKSKYTEVVTSIESGRLIKQCNVATDFSWTDVDFDYYINEIKKLVIE